MKERLYCLPGLVLSVTFSLCPSFRAVRLLLSLLGNDIKRGVTIHSMVRFVIPSRLSIGENSTINPKCLIDSRKGIKIGANAMVGRGCKIFTLGHDIDSCDFTSTGGPVEIGNYAVLFPYSIIMPNTKIGDGAVVYPGSVVTKDVPPNTVVGGSPAKEIRKRNVNYIYKLKYNTFLSV